jgi:transposase-like protein
MTGRVVIRYSECFKRQVVEDLERGRFASVNQARAHYGIGGAPTVGKWLRRFGKNELIGKVVRVEKLDEADRIRELQRRVAELERALGQTQAEKLLNEAYLEQACERLGEPVAGFKKKSGGKRCIGPGRGGAGR